MVGGMKRDVEAGAINPWRMGRAVGSLLGAGMLFLAGATG